MKTKTEKLTRRRRELLAELQEALGLFHYASDNERLKFCNISRSTLDADCRNEAIPWSVIQLHYYSLALRAARARSMGRTPDGTFCGSDVPQRTKSFAEILQDKRRNL